MSNEIGYQPDSESVMRHGEVGDCEPLSRSALDAYFALHDLVSDLVERGILTEATAPDDYQAVVAALLKCNSAHAALHPTQNH